MSVTTPTVHVPDNRLPVGSWIRSHLLWLVIALAVVATAVLVTLTVIDSDSSPEPAPVTQTDGVTSGIEYESIRATEHRTSNGGRLNGGR